MSALLAVLTVVFTRGTLAIPTCHVLLAYIRIHIAWHAFISYHSLAVLASNYATPNHYPGCPYEYKALTIFSHQQPRSKKRKPSFRRLLKTSNVKLDNKLKNRQFKKESTDKKHRKEQKKLRAAIKDAVLKTPLPLERYKKRPGVCSMTTHPYSSIA